MIGVFNKRVLGVLGVLGYAVCDGRVVAVTDSDSEFWYSRRQSS